MNELSQKYPPALKAAIVSCAVVLTMLFASATAAHAEEHHFCWGANLSPGVGCQSGNWNMTGAFANSSNGLVCLNLSVVNISACDHAVNEGVYIGGGGWYQHASIFHYNGFTIKVYGAFWT